MIALKDIRPVDNGAKFLNVDLHIHTYGGSADVKDPALTPEAIVDSAVKQNLSVIAITDHNSNISVEAAMAHAQQYADKLMVLPGVEVTTAHGHLLVYFAPENYKELGKFLVKIELIGEMGAENSRTAKSMADVIAEAEKHGAICVAAHIDREKTGFEKFAPGFQDWKRDIICSSGLYGLEHDDISTIDWYSNQDDSSPAGSERKKIYSARAATVKLEGRHHLAHLQGSDSHSLAQFESSDPNKVWTKIKLTELSWSAFRTALIDPTARVRPTQSVPRLTPRILGMGIAGGFLNGEKLHFSDNLNCLIGGRGTGKSTAIRALAYGLGMIDDFAEVENCPDVTYIFCEDANGIRFMYTRTRGNPPSVQAKEGDARTEVPRDSFRIEYFGQGMLAEVAKDPLNSPDLLQDFLDRHITLKDLEATETTLMSQLRENAARLAPLEENASQLGPRRQQIADITKKLKIAEEGNLKEIVEAQTKIAAEKSVVQNLEQISLMYASGVTLADYQRDFDQLIETAGELTGEAESEKELGNLRAVIEDSNELLTTKATELTEELKVKAAEIDRHLSALKQSHAKLDEEIATKIADLKTRGLAGDMTEIAQLIKDRAALTVEVTKTDQKKTTLQAIRRERTEFLNELVSARQKMTSRRKAQLLEVNKNLSQSIKDYKVFVKYDDAGIVDEFQGFLQSKMAGSYFQEVTCKAVCESLTPQELVDLVFAKDVKGIEEKCELKEEWAKQLIERLTPWNVLYELQILSKQPKPLIIVRTTSSPPREIPVKQLSDGQRHTILLTIAMLAESNIPLVIDQPEDDLDNAFIFESIVSTLRAVKERRQIILVTHNANIAVLGDSELILPMKRENDVGKVVDRGSIDKEATKNMVQQILEGSPAAFIRRQKIYGH